MVIVLQTCDFLFSTKAVCVHRNENKVRKTSSIYYVFIKLLLKPVSFSNYCMNGGVGTLEFIFATNNILLKRGRCFDTKKGSKKYLK